MNRKVKCKLCHRIIECDLHNIDKCPVCGSEKIEVILTLSDRIEFHEMAKGKTNKMPGKSKSYSEFQTGEEKSISRGYWVKKFRKIDRENNQYYEKVDDPKTGETIHKRKEPLTDHFGHGSDKHRKKQN